MLSVHDHSGSELGAHHQAGTSEGEGEEGAFDLEPFPSFPFGETFPEPLPGL